MKKIFYGVFIAIFCALFIVPAMAADVLVPTASGNDVIVPHTLIETIDGWEEGEVQCAFHDLVGAKSRVPMNRRGNNWIIIGGHGADIHPVVVIDGKDNWTKLENLWSMTSDFVKYRDAGPCIHVD
ncbi:hypothetical protein KAU09_00410 [Candidatus Parcubacteria bacterium]|nr:hypothetical protein [Candidatus Parcubacteria bacterium]